MNRFNRMYNFSLKSLAALFLVLTVVDAAKASVVKNAVKTPDLTAAKFCGREEQLYRLQTLNHVDERNRIDRIVISKKSKKLFLLAQGRLYKSYNTAFGFGFNEGNKIRIGDGRTPEGIYRVELKNDRSAYYKALRVSYPNEKDKAFAKALGVNPGTDIMIHGFPVREDKDLQRSALSVTHPQFNWTQGCVAVTNQEMDEIFSVVSVNTTIEICPAD